ncbi:MAG: phage tail terminator-like protein [Agrobacterium cavarae]|uniref:phage tail terminator-like protein n=1 Tax=Agrobacterium cavarae TaxID=2528239 RepID=UPI0031A855F4
MSDPARKTIFQALLLAAQAFPLPSGIQRADPGVTYAPSAESKFVSVEIHFNRSIRTDLSQEIGPIRQGFMRLNVMWPKKSAIVDAHDLSAQLEDAFKAGTKLYRNGLQVRIDEDPEASSLITGDTHYTVPLTIRWVCYPTVPA